MYLNQEIPNQEIHFRRQNKNRYIFLRKSQIHEVETLSKNQTHCYSNICLQGKIVNNYITAWALHILSIKYKRNPYSDSVSFEYKIYK